MIANKTAVFILSVLALLSVAGAANVTIGNPYSANALARSATLNAFFTEYIPANVVSNSTYYNTALGSDTYLLMRTNSSLYSFVIINTTSKSNYTFVFNITLPYEILQPYMFSKYYPSANTISNLTTQMQLYIKQSQHSLSDCLTVTGLDYRQCTANEPLIPCLQTSCQTVPICNEGINAFPPPSPFTQGIENFSVQYQILNFSEQNYLSLSSGISPSTISVYLNQLSSLLATISSTATQIPLNPIFPPPTNMTAQQESQICLQYSANNGPWYCYDVGLCEYTTFNSTILNNLRSQVSYLLSLPLSNSSITAIVQNATNNAQSFYRPVVYAKENATFQAFLSADTGSYNSLLANMSFVSARFQNASLLTAIAQLKSVYSGIIAKGPAQNTITANAMLSAAVSNALKAYGKDAAPYLAVYDAAINNTAKLYALQLDYKTIPYSLSALVSAQSQINIKMNHLLNSSQLSLIGNQLVSVSSGINGASPPFTFESQVNSLDAGLVSALIYGQSGPLPSKIASAPLYTALISLLIGIVILVIVYLATYHRLKSRGKIKLSPRVRRTWMILFALIFVLALIYAGATYVFAENANTFIPVSSFTSSVSASNSVYLLVNKTLAANASTISCIGALKATLAHEHKTVYEQNVTGYVCAAPYNKAVSAASCYERIIASDIPAVIFSEGSNSSIVYRGIYGTTLYASGNVTQGSACLLNTLFRVNG